MTSTLTQEATGSDWVACESCRTLVYRKRYHRVLRVCPGCGDHGRLDVEQRLEHLLDPGWRPVPVAPTVTDPLGFTDHTRYTDRLDRSRERTGLDDAVRVVIGTITGSPAVLAVMDFRFLGGSLGVAAGEAITTAAETALRKRLPLVLVTASGGARMQEGVLSLMQMAKTSAAMAALDEAGLLTITVVTDPTYGGVAASFASLADVILAEPGARMGFAGPRVIEQTIRQRLPNGFQRAEFLLTHGLVDDVRARAELSTTVGMLLRATGPGDPQWGEGEPDPTWRAPELVPELSMRELISRSRHPHRPTTLDHLALWAEGFLELHGDRAGADCPALVGGLAILDGLPVMVVGHQKGHSTTELVRRNFGMPSPAGYRKAARLLRLAAKLRIPVITLIDTPGAYPGIEAEEQGQAIAIAECIRLLSGIQVPVVSVVTGEGGSGGALALAVADRVLMCANAMYSVISPEGCAAILWKDAAAAESAAAAMRIDARSMLELGVVDAVIPEPSGGAHADPHHASTLIRGAVIAALREVRTDPGDRLVGRRRARFRGYGLAVPAGTGDRPGRYQGHQAPAEVRGDQ